MTCETCGEHPKKNTAKDFTKAVIEINNPETLVLLRKVVIPASMGDEEVVPPAVGKYHNTLLYYEVSGNSYLYSSDGIPTKVTGPKGEQGPEGPGGRDGRDGAIQYTAGTGIDISESNVISATGSASVSWGDINGSISNQTDLSDALATKQDTLTAGTNIAIDADNVISATDTTYTHFTGTDGQTDGTQGLVPGPLTTDVDKFLSADGTWQTPPDTTYTAGANITIGANNEISATDTTYSNFTGTDGVSAGTAGLVPGPTTSDTDKYLKSDGTWATVSGGGGPTVVQTTGTSTTDVMSQNAVTDALAIAGSGLTTLSYGISTWQDFITAYNDGKIVYCRASSNSNPATGSQIRMAFMAYINNPDSPTEVEFQYVRSVSTKSATNQSDQVFVYTLTNTNGGTWTVETRPVMVKISAGTNMTSSYSNNTLTLSADLSSVPTITIQTTDPGEGAPLAANNFIGVYE